ncbi:hypothetical protein ACIRSS_50200 [Amycolatopsis sp. NPDC101161]|uniref:hypothetical protein n=1 Tax=Amycolatopsis sp. NPDC101161 TaxID=3363940 RepID=UPI00380CFBC3
MPATATALDVFTDEDGSYHVVGPCTRDEALALMREHASANGDPAGPPAQAPADLVTGWVSHAVLDAPQGDPAYPLVPAGTPDALPITTSLS